jgi:hypothetical protein
MVEWGGHHGGWGGFGPPSYIVKKCPAMNGQYISIDGYGSRLWEIKLTFCESSNMTSGNTSHKSTEKYKTKRFLLGNERQWTE